MSSVNVIPSAPKYAETLYPMNEIAQIDVEDFRLKKISDLQTEHKNEAEHYRQVAKNINEHTPWLTSQLWVLVRFLLDYRPRPLQQP